MLTYSLVCLAYPHQLLPAITAILHYRKYNQLLADSPVILAVWSHQVGANFSIIHHVVADIPWIKIINLNAEAIKKNFSPYLTVLKRAANLRNLMVSHACSEIFYAHDVSGDFTAQVFMQAFPEAKRICYGDALGMVYSNAYFESLTYPIQTNSWSIKTYFKNHLALWKRWYVLPPKSKRLDADIAILIMPSDPGGDFLLGKKMLIPSREEVLQVIRLLKKGLPEFYRYLEKLTYITPKKRYLFALGNLTASKITTLENEIALYEAIIERYVEKGSILILKLHPGSDVKSKELFINKISQYYELHIFSEEFNKVPIELAEPLMHACEVLSLSYTSLSLAYLYDVNVIHVLDEKLIRRYVNPASLEWMLESNQQYLDMIAALENWDSQSVLLNESMKRDTHDRY